jgi:hypothetical protein
MASSNDDGFDPYWMNETDWLVDVVGLPEDALPDDMEVSLDYIGRLFAFSVATDTRMLAQVGNPEMTTYELWFSFSSEKQKQEFLTLVRDDGYADPDEEACFFVPPSFDDLADLRPIALVFSRHQSDHITAIALQTMISMGIEEKGYLN